MRLALALALAPAAMAVALSACQLLADRHGPAPRACGMAQFGAAPGLALPSPSKPARRDGKSVPMAYATAIPLNRSVYNLGEWVDAGGGWKAWRVWLHSDEARSLAVRIEPFSLPPEGQLWLCASDGTARLGPYTDAGPGAMGKLWSPAVSGNELWIEALVPENRVGDVKLSIVEAQAAYR